MNSTDKIYVKGNDKVIAILKRTLGSGASNEISYETTLNSFNEKCDSSTITLEIDKLRVVKLDEAWDVKQPNDNKLLTNRIATLVIYYGNVESFGNGTAPSIQITKDSVFIAWRVESVEYLTSIATSLKHNSELSIKIDLTVNDDFFEAQRDLCNADIGKISITFN